MKKLLIIVFVFCGLIGCRSHRHANHSHVYTDRAGHVYTVARDSDGTFLWYIYMNTNSSSPSIYDGSRTLLGGGTWTRVNASPPREELEETGTDVALEDNTPTETQVTAEAGGEMDGGATAIDGSDSDSTADSSAGDSSGDAGSSDGGSSGGDGGGDGGGGGGD